MMTRLTAIAVFTAVMFVGATQPAQAEITRMSVHVDGLTCPFCVFNLEKKLKPLRNVTDVKINLKTGNAAVVLGKGRGPTVGEIKQAVRDAGFTPGQMGLTAVGTLVAKDRYVLLSVRSVDEVKPAYKGFYLYQKGQEEEFFDKKTRARLQRLAAEEKLVAVTGDVHEHAEGLPELSTDEVKTVPKEKDKKDSDR